MVIANIEKGEFNDETHAFGPGRRSDIPGGKTASWKACGWNNDDILACSTGTITE